MYLLLLVSGLHVGLQDPGRDPGLVLLRLHRHPDPGGVARHKVWREESLSGGYIRSFRNPGATLFFFPDSFDSF